MPDIVRTLLWPTGFVQGDVIARGGLAGGYIRTSVRIVRLVSFFALFNDFYTNFDDFCIADERTENVQFCCFCSKSDVKLKISFWNFKGNIFAPTDASACIERQNRRSDLGCKHLSEPASS